VFASTLSDTTPATLAEALRQRGVPGVSLLESGLALGGLGQRSFLAARPLAVAVAPPGEPLALREGPRSWGRDLARDPLRAAAQILERARPASVGQGFSGGGVLTLSYDLGRRYEEIEVATPSEVDPPPDLHLAIYGRVLEFDHSTGQQRWLGAGPGLNPEDVEHAVSHEEPLRAAASVELGEQSLDRARYREAVEEARGRIRRGDFFEVNLSRRHRLPRRDPDCVARALRRLAPAAYMADLDLPHGRRLLSASPERFLFLDAGGHVNSWPIKGTRPRGSNPEQDAALASELMSSEKDAAELAMIVDLVRNDLGRVAKPGSVVVSEPRLLHSWPTVHHTAAVVEAELAEGRDWADLVRAAFPPGSVTGAPKVAAMQAIESLEPVRRGLYCGAFGWVGFDGSLDLAVAIRILDVTANLIDLHAGGAVLLDSCPAAEEEEARAKASALLRAVAEAR
jgi:para-aminobenzoate synthetase component 1